MRLASLQSPARARDAFAAPPRSSPRSGPRTDERGRTRRSLGTAPRGSPRRWPRTACRPTRALPTRCIPEIGSRPRALARAFSRLLEGVHERGVDRRERLSERLRRIFVLVPKGHERGFDVPVRELGALVSSMSVEDGDEVRARDRTHVRRDDVAIFHLIRSARAARAEHSGVKRSGPRGKRRELSRGAPGAAGSGHARSASSAAPAAATRPASSRLADGGAHTGSSGVPGARPRSARYRAAVSSRDARTPSRVGRDVGSAAQHVSVNRATSNATRAAVSERPSSFVGSEGRSPSLAIAFARSASL